MDELDVQSNENKIELWEQKKQLHIFKYKPPKIFAVILFYYRICTSTHYKNNGKACR